MIRRFGERPIPGQTYRPRPGVYVILPRGDQVLITWQGGMHNEYQLPGGGVDPGEHPIQALHREVREETGWRIARPRRLGAHRRFVFMPDYDKWAEKICTIYVADPIRPISDPTEPDHSAVWVPQAKAADMVATAGDAHFIAQMFR